MTQLEISGTVDLPYEAGEAIDRVIYRAAAEQLLEHFNLKAITRDAVQKHIDDALGALVLERVQALLDKPIPQTDRWGDPTGEPKPFRDVFADRAEAYLAETVDSHGRPAKRQAGVVTVKPRLVWLLEEVGANHFEAEARKVAKEVKSGLERKAREAVAKVAADAVKVR